MPSRQQVSDFIRATFRSVWAVELLSFLRTNRQRAPSQAEMVRELRASDLVVAQSLKSLAAAGLVELVAGGARYRPASPELDIYAAITEANFATSPASVRHLIAADAPHEAANPVNIA